MSGSATGIHMGDLGVWATVNSTGVVLERVKNICEISQMWEKKESPSFSVFQSFTCPKGTEKNYQWLLMQII